MAYVTVANCMDPAEAQLIRSRLEAAGYDARLTHEISEINTPGYTGGGEGIPVKVPEEQAEEVKALLRAEEQQGEGETS